MVNLFRLTCVAYQATSVGQTGVERMSFVNIARANYVGRIGVAAPAPADVFEYLITVRIAGRTKLKYVYAATPDAALAVAVKRWPGLPIERVESMGRRV